MRLAAVAMLPKARTLETAILVTRSDLVRALAERHHLTRTEARLFVDTLFASIAAALAQGQKVSVDGFGVFQVRHRAAREQTNPKTRTRMHLEARDVPVFRPAQRLKQDVNASCVPQS